MEFRLYSKAPLARSEMTYIEPHKAENGSAVEIMMSSKAGKEQDLISSLLGAAFVFSVTLSIREEKVAL